MVIMPRCVVCLSIKSKCPLLALDQCSTDYFDTSKNIWYEINKSKSNRVTLNIKNHKPTTSYQNLTLFYDIFLCNYMSKYCNIASNFLKANFSKKPAKNLYCNGGKNSPLPTIDIFFTKMEVWKRHSKK